MEKRKKRIISSALLVALIAVVVFCALVFGDTQTNNAVFEDSVVAEGNSADGMTTGIYNQMSKDEAIAYYNDLVNNKGYEGIDGQAKFAEIFGSGQGVEAKKYALRPYDDEGNAIVYEGQGAAYMNNTTLDGCGATLKITSMPGVTELSNPQQTINLPNGDKGYGSGTFFELNKRRSDDGGVYIKVSGGLAGYALGVHLSNLNVEYTANLQATSGGIEDDAASYCFGGLFGVLSVGDVANVNGTPSVIENCRIYNNGLVNMWKGVNGSAWVKDMNCRPYHALASFGTIAAYCYNSQFINSTVELGNDMSLVGHSAGAKNGIQNNGLPRVAIGGAFGIVQNDSLISNIYVTGGGKIDCSVSSTYWQVDGSAKLGMGGALVGCVVDGGSNEAEFMVNGQGTTYIKNIVSNWQGTVRAQGEVNSHYTYDKTLTGVIVGINGHYIGTSAASNMSGIYYLYSGDTAPDYFSNFWGSLEDDADSYKDFKYTYINITEDGSDWLNMSAADRKTSVEFDESGNNLVLTYDVSSMADTRTILWEYSLTTVGSSSNPQVYSTWRNKTDGDGTVAVTSYETAVKTQTVTFKNVTENTATSNTKVAFVSGQAAYYKVAGQDGWSAEDSKVGSVGVRTYQVENRQYNASIINAPSVEFYLTPDFSGAAIATSQDNAQWGAQKNGSGNYIEVGSDETKNVNNWYLSLRTDGTDDAYAYYATVDGKNYVAYKAENTPSSSASGLEGTAISMRYYVYIVTPKIITPTVTPEADLVYDAAAKEYIVDFAGQICEGDSVNATLSVFAVANGVESPLANGAVDAGTYRVRISGLSNTNYALSESIQDCDFEITKRALTSSIGTESGFVYNKTAQSPSVTFAGGVEGVDLSGIVSVIYKKEGVISSNIDAGTYEIGVSLTSEGDKNYTLGGTTTGSFSIAPAPLVYKGLDSYEFTYDSYSIGVQKLSDAGIYFANDDLGYTCDFTVSFSEAGKGEYVASSVTYVIDGGYDCKITPNNESNYYFEGDNKIISVNVKKATVTFGITPNYGDASFDENNSVVYTGNNMTFIASTAGLGTLDKNSYKFEVKVYPAVFDSEANKWVKQEGAEGVSTVHDAGNYIAILEQTKGGSLDEDPNYDTVSNPGTREFAFTIKKATLKWEFSGEGLNYHEESGEYWAEYNGKTFTLTFESGDLESQLAEGDKGGLYLLTGNIEYIKHTEQGDFSVGTKGVRDAGNYYVVPEVECGNNPELSVNYEIKGGMLAIQQRVVTIVIKDVKVPYGTHFDEITGEDFSNMWYYAPDSLKFLPEDGPMLTFYLRDIGMEEVPVRGTYPYTFLPSLVNENVSNYQINKVNEHGDNSYCTITGLELKVEVVVTDKDGVETVYNVESGTSFDASALYNGGKYTVSLRATNADPEYIGVEFKVPGYVFKDNKDSKTVRFELKDEVNAVYFIGADKSATDEPDGIFDVNFTVNKRNVEVNPANTNVEYGKEFVAAGETFGGDGFAEGESSDLFLFTYKADGLGAEVGSTADITVEVAAKDGNEIALGNYNFICNNGVATRVPRVLHITFGDREKTYGDEILAIEEGNYTLAEGESVVEGDSLGLKYVLTKDGETYADAVNLGAGTYAISATADNANYEIIVTEGAQFNVNPKKANVTLESVTASYDNAAHPITVVVIDGLIAGDEGVTATVQYLLDGQAIDGEPVNIGVYTANVTGFSSPNYSVGEVSGTTTVEITNIAVNVTVNDAVMAYGTGNILPAGDAFFTCDNEIFNSADLEPYYIYNNGEGDVTTLALGEYPGTLTLGFKGEAAGNFDITFTNSAKLTVNAADLAEVAYLEEDSSVYDGNGKSVVVAGVQSAQVEVRITKDGVEVDRNTGVVDAGEYVVEVTPLGSNYVGKAVLTYTVEKAALDATLSVTSSAYNGKAVDLASLINSKYGEVVFTITMNGETVNEVKNAGTYTITVTAGENSNYTGSVEGLTYTVGKVQIATPTRDDLTVTAVWNGFTIVDKNGKHEVLVTLTDGKWEGATNSVSGLNPETDYTVYVKFAGDDNYIESGVFSMTVTTGKKQAATLDPKDVSYTAYYNKIVVSVKGEGSFAYSSDGGRTWQDGNTLSGLKANTEYSVSVKIKESDTQGESNVVTVKVKTGSDPAAFNDMFNSFGDSLTAADLDNYDKMMDAYEGLADGDKSNVDKAKLDKLQAAYDTIIAEVNGDVIAAQNVARKAAGKGAAAAAASVLAVVAAAIVAKKKFVF